MSDRKTYLYRVYDNEQKLIYVGISLSFFSRLQQHKKNSVWFDRMSTVTLTQYTAREEALFAEATAINTENPQMNIMRPRSKELELAQKVLADRSRNDRKAWAHPDASRDYLYEKVVRFEVLYSLSEAANILNLTRKMLDSLVENNTLGHILLPAKPGKNAYGQPHKPKTMVSGWQIIDYLEGLHTPQTMDRRKSK
jgi:predicted GIY-YIG superfamily endonuclease